MKLVWRRNGAGDYTALRTFPGQRGRLTLAGYDVRNREPDSRAGRVRAWRAYFLTVPLPGPLLRNLYAAQRVAQQHAVRWAADRSVGVDTPSRVLLDS